MESPDSMELKVISCKHLKAFNFFQKLAVYAVLSIISDESKNSHQKQKIRSLQRQKTPVDRDGNGNPEWNHQLQFDLREILPADIANHFVKFSLRCEGIVYGNKSIGEVCVPLKDLIEEFNRPVKFVSYQVRTADGKPNGVLTFSYKLIKKGSELPAVEAPEDRPLPHPHPSVEIEESINAPKKDSLYPSLDVSALPAISLSNSYCTPVVYKMAPPQPPLPPPPPPVVPKLMDGAYYHPRPLVYASQPSYDHDFCRYYSAVDAVGGVDGAGGDGWRTGIGSRGDGFRGSWTFR